jgi:hypothetical protein
VENGRSMFANGMAHFLYRNSRVSELFVEF